MPTVGTLLHDIARRHIQFRTKLRKYDQKTVMLELLDKGIPGFVLDAIDFEMIFNTLLMYVNDCIGYRMKPEVVLRYSSFIYGTTDAIRFDEEARFLRINDFKSGTTKAHMEQLLIYAAIFCLEYHIDPKTIDAELNIYQLGEIERHNPTSDELRAFMDAIVGSDKTLNKMTEED